MSAENGINFANTYPPNLGKYWKKRLNLPFENTPQKPRKYLRYTYLELSNGYALRYEFDIPDAASRVLFTVNLHARALTAAIFINSPTDRKYSKSNETWLRKQLENCKDNDITVVANYPRRPRHKVATLGEQREDQSILLADNSVVLPTSF